MMKNYFVMILIFFIVAVSPEYLLAKSKNFDECILENIASSSTNAAVAAITRACRNLFPEVIKDNQSSTIKKTPQFKIITLRKNDSKWVKNFGRDFFRINVTNKTDFVIYGIRDSSARIWLEFRVVGCDKRIATRDEMRNIQRALNNRGFNAGSPDGSLGSKTISALKKFQSRNNLTVNGKINKSTVNKLNVSVAYFDETRKMTVGGYIPGNQINPRESRYVDFDIDSFLPDDECFFSDVKAKVEVK